MSRLGEVNSVESFDQILSDSRSNLVVVHFSAKWSEQCQQMNDVMTELAKTPQLVNVRFLQIESEDVPELTMKYNVTAVPMFLFFKNKTQIDQLEGANPAELSKKVNHLVSATVPTPHSDSSSPSSTDLNSRLKSLIHMAPVVLFMKGSPDEPKCGFSRTITAILRENNIDYAYFDILGDDTVRQGLKTFSNWPTYPQLYHNGELIGGLDIVKELAESDELKTMLPQKEDLESRLKTLINKAPIMLFMKGSPDAPRCGFSRTTTAILKETGISYETFDILQDEEVRQGLKKFSQWPTYPQLYVKGELIGGLDIIKELQESGDLVNTLKEGGGEEIKKTSEEVSTS